MNDCKFKLNLNFLNDYDNKPLQFKIHSDYYLIFHGVYLQFYFTCISLKTVFLIVK